MAEESDISPAKGALQAVGLVAVPFLIYVAIALELLGGVPLLGIGGADHGDHGGDHAEATEPADH